MMKIVVTLREVLNNYDWDKFCEMRGLNPYCINEGLADGDDEVTLTQEEAQELGIIKEESHNEE
jgi:hypothetical protein